MREDWIECTLDKLVSEQGLFSDGDWVEKKDQDLDGEVRLIQLADIGDGFFRDKSNKRVTHKWATENNCSFLKTGDILIARMPDPLGRATIFPLEGEEKYITAVDVAILRTSNTQIHQGYLLHLINNPSIRNEIDKLKSGTTRKRISRKNLNKIHFQIAPLPEQRAIVAKIEALFSDLDKGIADLKKAQDQLTIYRQAVLKKAFEGELTKEKAEPEIIKLGSVIDKPRYGTSKKCSLEPKGIAVLRIPNIGEGLINPEELKYAEFDAKEISTLKLQEGDILTIRSNGSVDLVGKCALITKSDVDYLYAGYLIRLRPDKELIDSKFLLYSLKSHDLRVQIESKAKSTSGVNNINSGEIASLEIPHFKLEIQHQIVQEIESRLSVCDKVEESITESLEKAEALRQSILKKAFEGRLLSKAEVSACKAAPDYEPASVLLARIEQSRNERVKAEKKKKS